MLAFKYYLELGVRTFTINNRVATKTYLSVIFTLHSSPNVLLGTLIYSSVPKKLLQITYSWKGEASWKYRTSFFFNVFRKVYFSSVSQRLNHVRVGGQLSNNRGFSHVTLVERRGGCSLIIHFLSAKSLRTKACTDIVILNPACMWCCNCKLTKCCISFA